MNAEENSGNGFNNDDWKYLTDDTPWSLRKFNKDGSLNKPYMKRLRNIKWFNRIRSVNVNPVKWCYGSGR